METNELQELVPELKDFIKVSKAQFGAMTDPLEKVDSCCTEHTPKTGDKFHVVTMKVWTKLSEDFLDYGCKPVGIVVKRCGRDPIDLHFVSNSLADEFIIF